MIDFKAFFRGVPVTNAIVIICTVAYAVIALQAFSLTSTSGSSLGDRMILWAPLVQAEPLGWIRMFTSAFMHLDIGHLVINMMMLILIGGEVERFLGSARYLLVYLVGAFGSSLAVLFMAPINPTAGASGALYALMAIFVAISARTGSDIRGPLVLVAVNVAYTFMAVNVSVWGHLGGLVTGMLLAWPVTRNLKFPQY